METYNKKYYKAELYYSSELYVNNDLNQGIDPETHCYCGLVDAIERNTLEELKQELISRYETIEHFEDNRYETSYDEIERDGTKILVSISIYVYYYDETIRTKEVDFENQN